eukprot:CAMPEP_0178797146 /NCGR_PEP_ID=MMETSP0745-20121128/11055_1 /TAXON_ID=913974 /ORGANISM="Nitzschia punctata, Strain CCMP561" /LENGTH=287 /DNA_ID=CAMNT_0020455689 /DNA_START=11 /DNA_END=874 /DNA_ORIENTATION=-
MTGSIASDSATILNNKGYVLFSRGLVSESIEVFKLALSALKRELAQGQQSMAESPSLQHDRFHEKWESSSDYPANPLNASGSFFPMPRMIHPSADASSFHNHRHCMVYSRPIFIHQEQANLADVSRDDSLAGKAAAITFNLAIAYHLRAFELLSSSRSSDDNKEASPDAINDVVGRAFSVSRAMYELTLRQIQSAPRTSKLHRDGIVYAALLNNLSHVHETLASGIKNNQDQQAKCGFFEDELLKTVLFFVHSGGQVLTQLQLEQFQIFLQNVFHRVLQTPAMAPAA